VVGKDPVELEKYLEKKIALPEEDISALILFNTILATLPFHFKKNYKNLRFFYSKVRLFIKKLF
jgi:hypothetical protein